MNDNGVDDSVDRASGVAVQNSKIWDPNCWPEPSWTLEHGLLGPCVPDSIGRYMQVDYNSSGGLVHVTSAVGVRTAAVRIVLMLEDADSVVVFAGDRPRGMHGMSFRPVDKAGRVLAHGKGQLSVTIGKDRYERPIAWLWRESRAISAE